MSSLNSVRPQRFFTLGDIMRITIRAMCQNHNELNVKILHCRFELSKMCPAFCLFVPKFRMPFLNLFNHFHQIKAQKLDQLIGPQNTSDSSPESLKTAISIPEKLPLSDSEKSVRS